MEPILQQWTKVLALFRTTRDIPWGYRERAQVGFFAGAVWLTGNIALEEWSSAKGEDLDAWISMVKTIKHDAIAWYLPGREALYFEEGHNLGAGLVLLINKAG